MSEDVNFSLRKRLSERSTLDAHRRIEAVENRFDLSLAAMAAILLRLAPRRYRDRNRIGKPAITRSRDERVAVLAERHARGQSLWCRYDAIEMRFCNALPFALRCAEAHPESKVSQT